MLLAIIFARITPINLSCYRAINTSILQKPFYLSKNIHHAMQTFLVFKLGLITLVAQPVFILWAKLWKVRVKSKTAMFYFWHPFSQNIRFWGCDIFFCTLHWPSQPNFFRGSLNLQDSSLWWNIFCS